MRTTGFSNSKAKTTKTFEEWIEAVFHGDPSIDDLNDIAANDEQFDYRTTSDPVVPLSSDLKEQNAS